MISCGGSRARPARQLLRDARDAAAPRPSRPVPARLDRAAPLALTGRECRVRACLAPDESCRGGVRRVPDADRRQSSPTPHLAADPATGCRARRSRHRTISVCRWTSSPPRPSSTSRCIAAAYRVAGSATRLVLIHGMINSSRHWEAVATRLAGSHRVIAAGPDRPRRRGDAARRLLARAPMRRASATCWRRSGSNGRRSSATRSAAASRCSSSTSSPSAPSAWR